MTKYNKIKPEDILKMRKMRYNGESYASIGRKFKVFPSVIIYHLDENYKREAIENATKNWNKLSKVKKKKKYKKNKKYIKKYMVERYNNDPEFRERIKEVNRTNKKRKYNKYIKNGLCTQCGRKRENKEWRRCEKCRIKHRK